MRMPFRSKEISMSDFFVFSFKSACVVAEGSRIRIRLLIEQLLYLFYKNVALEV